jgi:hypothetical protein
LLYVDDVRTDEREGMCGIATNPTIPTGGFIVRMPEGKAGKATVKTWLFNTYYSILSWWDSNWLVGESMTFSYGY